jgi:hypothetical protein
VATLSSPIAVVLPALLLLHDLVARRRPSWPLVIGGAAIGLPIVAVQTRVGALGGVVGKLLGGDRMTAAASMGPVWLRTLAHATWPFELSAAYDVPVRSAYDEHSWLGWVLLVGWAVAGAVAWRRGGRALAIAAVWFIVGLAPVSQVLVPLQHALADRYLLLAVLGPCLLIVATVAPPTGWRRPRLTVGRYAPVVLATIAAAFAAATGARADLFADPVALWLDASDKTTSSAWPAYQLALALTARGDDHRAEPAFRTALERARGHGDVARRATNNLAALLVRAGRLDEAQELLRTARARFPDDPKVLANLANVLERRGELDEANALNAELERRFPDYVARRRGASVDPETR